MHDDITQVTTVLGTMSFGDTVDESVASRMVDLALEQGSTLIDTANGYAGGESERMLSRILPAHRDHCYIATKAGMPTSDAAGRPPLSRDALTDSVENSLGRLGREHIDVLYLHQPDRETPLEETLQTVAELHSAGKVRALGVSNFSAWQISDVTEKARLVGAPRVIVAQQLYNLLARTLEREYAEYAQVHDLATMVYNPLAGGLLTGRHSLHDSPANGRFGSSGLAEMYRRRYWTPELFEAVEALKAIASDSGMSLVEISFRWLLSKPTVSSILLAGSSVEQLAQNIGFVGKGRLDPQLVETLDETTAPLLGSMPPYNR